MKVTTVHRTVTTSTRRESATKTEKTKHTNKRKMAIGEEIDFVVKLQERRGTELHNEQVKKNREILETADTVSFWVNKGSHFGTRQGNLGI